MRARCNVIRGLHELERQKAAAVRQQLALTSTLQAQKVRPGDIAGPQIRTALTLPALCKCSLCVGLEV